MLLLVPFSLIKILSVIIVISWQINVIDGLDEHKVMHYRKYRVCGPEPGNLNKLACIICKGVFNYAGTEKARRMLTKKCCNRGCSVLDIQRNYCRGLSINTDVEFLPQLSRSTFETSTINPPKIQIKTPMAAFETGGEEKPFICKLLLILSVLYAVILPIAILNIGNQ